MKLLKVVESLHGSFELTDTDMVKTILYLVAALDKTSSVLRVARAVQETADYEKSPL